MYNSVKTLKIQILINLHNFFQKENFIKKNEVNKKDESTRRNYDILNNYWHIEIIKPKNTYSLLGQTKNPIIIRGDKNQKIKTEKDLELVILSELKLFFKELGEGFAFIDI